MGLTVHPNDVFNKQLVQKLHPDNWINPTPKKKYNLVVIGAGPAGLVTAAGAAGLGAKVALVERHLMGGDCLNFGCVPSKALLKAAHVVDEAKNAHEFGLSFDEAASVDFGRIMEDLRKKRDNLAHHDSVERFAGLGVDVFLGGGQFTSPDCIEVNGAELKFHRAVIATGARAALPPIEGLKNVDPLVNESLFSLTELPSSLTVIGAGPIGCEMAQAFARFGAEVTLLDMADRILPNEDPDASDTLQKQLAKDGVDLVLNAKILCAASIKGLKTITIEKNGEEILIKSEEVLVAAGRKPNLEGLGLEVGGIKYNNKGVVVDDQLRTSNSTVYAAGDICSTFQFTHSAESMAKIAIQNTLFFGRKKVSALVMPWCTYTYPEVAHVGITSVQADENKKDISTYTVQMSEVDRAILEGEDIGFARVHIDKKSGSILGATMVSAHAGESISQMTLAITSGLQLSDIANAIHPYPIQAEAWKKLANNSMKEKFTPLVAKIFSFFLGLSSSKD